MLDGDWFATLQAAVVTLDSSHVHKVAVTVVNTERPAFLEWLPVGFRFLVQSR